MIPFFNLDAQQVKIKEQIKKRLDNVFSHGKYILGPEVSELEERLEEYTGAKYCITCANGTDALQIVLMAIGISTGDEVITPSFSYIAAAEAIKLLGAKPVYVEVDPKSFNINPELIEENITSKTKAILPVSLFGRPANFNKINDIAQKYSLIVIEDAAQSFGAILHKKKSCNLSTISCTSFFPTKPLGCYGDGGAIFTSNEEIAIRVRQIAKHGQKSRYNHTILGVNSRLDTIQAAILLCKIDLLNDEIKARQIASEIYSESFKDLEWMITPLPDNSILKSAWSQYTIKVKNRKKFIDYLNLKEIPYAIHYPLPLNFQPAVADHKIECPISYSISQSVLSLPLFELSKKNQKKIIDIVKSFL